MGATHNLVKSRMYRASGNPAQSSGIKLLGAPCLAKAERWKEDDDAGTLQVGPGRAMIWWSLRMDPQAGSEKGAPSTLNNALELDPGARAGMSPFAVSPGQQ